MSQFPLERQFLRQLLMRTDRRQGLLPFVRYSLGDSRQVFEVLGLLECPQP